MMFSTLKKRTAKPVPDRPDPQQVANHFEKALVELVDAATRDYARPYAIEAALERQLTRLRMSAAARPW